MLVLALAATPLRPRSRASRQPPPVVDSVAVEGNVRLTPAQVIGTAAIVPGQVLNFIDVQRALTSLFATGQYDDIQASLRQADGKVDPGPRRQGAAPVCSTGRSGAPTGSPSTACGTGSSWWPGGPSTGREVARSSAAIDSMYRTQGYYSTTTRAVEVPGAGGVRVVFEIKEGSRVAVSQVNVEGNTRFSDKQIVKQMGTQPEGFWWFKKGRYDEDVLDQDLRERLPKYYGERGLIDFQVVGDTLVSDSLNGKAALTVQVDEGVPYYVGTFVMTGNRQFSTDQLADVLSLRHPRSAPGTRPDSTQPAVPFNRKAWEDALGKVEALYRNNGYIYVEVDPKETRRVAPDGTHYIDLQWQIREGQLATINRINIVGNDVTHERVIREAIVLIPGAVFSQERLIRSYQNIANLGFFSQPMPFPDIEPSANGKDVDITFKVEEKRTGNFNFGASLGQGYGLGGFFGIEEPNLFGRGKRVRFQWQFGKNINDFTLSYTDPAIRDSRVSGTMTLFNSRQRFTIADLGRRRQEGGIGAARASPSSGPATPGCSPPTGTSGFSTPTDRPPSASASTAPAAAAPPWEARCCGIPGSACRSPPAGTMASIQGELNGGFLGGTGRLPEGGPRRPLVCAARLHRRQPAAGKRRPVRAGAHRQVRVHLRRRGAVLHRALLDGRHPVRRPAARLRRILDHPERVRSQRRWQPGQRERLRQVVRGLHRRVRGPGQPVGVLQLVHGCRECLSQRAAV